MSNQSLFFLNLDRDYSERYELERFMEYTDNYDILTSAILLELRNISPSGRFVVNGQDARPDLVSFEIYGDVQYWWIILLYNEISEIGELITGMELKYPSQSDLEQYYFTLKSRQATA